MKITYEVIDSDGQIVKNADEYSLLITPTGEFKRLYDLPGGEGCSLSDSNCTAEIPLIKKLVNALELALDKLSFTCCDGCTCGDSWNHSEKILADTINDALKEARGIL